MDPGGVGGGGAPGGSKAEWLRASAIQVRTREQCWTWEDRSKSGQEQGSRGPQPRQPTPCHAHALPRPGPHLSLQPPQTPIVLSDLSQLLQGSVHPKKERAFSQLKTQRPTCRSHTQQAPPVSLLRRAFQTLRVTVSLVPSLCQQEVLFVHRLPSQQLPLCFLRETDTCRAKSQQSKGRTTWELVPSPKSPNSSCLVPRWTQILTPYPSATHLLFFSPPQTPPLQPHSHADQASFSRKYSKTGEAGKLALGHLRHLRSHLMRRRT